MEPLNRKEFFLNAIAEGTPTPPPLTREERYLAKIAENTSGDSLPPIEEGDDGKVLTASDGEAAWANVSGLPEITDVDDGKLLGAFDGEAAWVAGRGLPDITGEDDGKILTIDDDTPVWSENPLFDPYARYDLVFSYEGLLSAATKDNVTFVKGALDTCEEKIANGLPVTGVFFQFRKNPSIPVNIVMFDTYYLSFYNADYRYIRFASSETKSSDNGGTIIIQYDEYYNISSVSRL